MCCGDHPPVSVAGGEAVVGLAMRYFSVLGSGVPGDGRRAKQYTPSLFSHMLKKVLKSCLRERKYEFGGASAERLAHDGAVLATCLPAIARWLYQ